MLGVRARKISVLKDIPSHNGSWLVELPRGQRAVLRRYFPWATAEDLAYEHAVAGHLAVAGWVVPQAVSEPVRYDGRFYCLTRYVPGQPAVPESAAQRRRRGCDLARLHLALRDLTPRLGQRPGWRPQCCDIAGNSGIDWAAGARGLMTASPRHASWLRAAVERTSAELTAIGAAELPLTVIHGDFAEWNVHYLKGRLAGVIDFALTHLDARPYELAIARTYRAPEATAAYRAELARNGWPLSALEEAAITPVYRAFRLGMTAWELDHGLKTGVYDLSAIERQLSRTGTPAPG